MTDALDGVEKPQPISLGDAALLLEANEQLVLSALRARTEADHAIRGLSELSRSAELDSLTELPNRTRLLDRFAHAIAAAKRRRTRLAVLFVDIDQFKQINDAWGHSAGDQALQSVARCLTASVREADTVSRYGGDEFVVLLADVGRPRDAVVVAEKILAGLGESHRAGEAVFRLTASIGISVYPDDGDSLEDLIGHADAAMYRSKKQGLGGYAFHGELPAGDAASMPAELDALPWASARSDPLPARLSLLHDRMREANEALVLAALAAQELQEAAEQALRRQTEFLAVLAHELRHPLAPIRTAAAVLAHAGGDVSKLTRLPAIIERQVAHLARLVDDLFDVSRVTTGKLRLDRRPVDLAGVIDQAIDTCRPRMDSRRQHFAIRRFSRQLTVFGDPVRLAQILINLLDNASKYTPEGGDIGVDVDASDESVTLTVSDSGIGIVADALSTIFEPFVQDAVAVRFNGGGLGIGLAVVRELVEAHGGSVVAHSAGTGRGSRFVLTLPLAGPASH